MKSLYLAEMCLLSLARKLILMLMLPTGSGSCYQTTGLRSLHSNGPHNVLHLENEEPGLFPFAGC